MIVKFLRNETFCKLHVSEFRPVSGFRLFWIIFFQLYIFVKFLLCIYCYHSHIVYYYNSIVYIFQQYNTFINKLFYCLHNALFICNLSCSMQNSLLIFRLDNFTWKYLSLPKYPQSLASFAL